MEKSPPPQLKLIPFSESDIPFLKKVYASTRDWEMALTDWPEEQIANFLNMQFELQHTHYQKYYPNAEFSIIHINDTPVGRLYLERTDEDILIIDIALLTEFRGKGYGYRLMKDIMAEGQQKNLPVRLHVEKLNPAMTFYNKLGFKNIKERDIYYLMEWMPT